MPTNVSRCAAKSEYPKGRCFLTRGNMQPAKYIPWGYYRDSFLRGHDAREVCELKRSINFKWVQNVSIHDLHQM